MKEFKFFDFFKGFSEICPTFASTPWFALKGDSRVVAEVSLLMASCAMGKSSTQLLCCVVIKCCRYCFSVWLLRSV